MQYNEINFPNNPQTWFIGFTPYAGRSKLIRKFIHPLIGHCFAITAFDGGLMIVEQTEKCLAFRTVIHPWGSDICAELYCKQWILLNPTARFVKVEKQDFASIFRAPILNTCVSSVKELLGIGGFAFTPYGLFKTLIRKGGQEIFND